MKEGGKRTKKEKEWEEGSEKGLRQQEEERKRKKGREKRRGVEERRFAVPQIQGHYVHHEHIFLVC